MQSIITVNHLSKTYSYKEKEEGLKGSLKNLFKSETRKRQAVDDFSFIIEQPDIVGLIGPNGAGKTTLIKMLTGIIKPTSGNASVLGFDPTRSTNAYKKQFAVVMGQKSQLWWDLPAIETFRLNQAIYEIPDESFRRNVDWLTELFNVAQYLTVPVRQLSLGERMKMELIASLLHDPKVLFLDEPTIGLDAIAQRQIRELLQQVNQEKQVTILLTSHYMKDIRSLCERVIVIRKGEKVYDGELEALLNTYKENIKIHLRFSEATTWYPANGIEIKNGSPLQRSYQVKREAMQDFLGQAVAASEVADIRIEEEELDDLVEQIYTMQAGGQP